jgi:hypothetical protein
MKPLNAFETAPFDLNALSQGECTALYREATRIGRRERSKAVRDLFLAAAQSLRGRPLLVRAFVDSIAVLVMTIALGAMMADPAAARIASRAIDHVHAKKNAVYCNTIDGMAGERRGCLLD